MSLRHRCAVVAVAAVAILSGCGQSQATGPSSATATIAPLFQAPAEPLPTSTAIPAPTPAARPTNAERQTLDDLAVDTLIYTDGFAPGWSTDESIGVDVDAAFRRVTASGKAAIEAEPGKPYAELILSLDKGARVQLRRSEVLGVRFLVSGGERIMPFDALAVTVFGSNRYPYFVPGDDSARLPDGRITEELPLFPETRLYYLGVNRDIQPGEWAEVIVWLDEHPYPDITYITGIIIKNDEAFVEPFYIDDVAIITARR